MIKKFGLLLTILCFSFASLGGGVIQAVTAADWRAGRIIDDSIFTDKNSMSIPEIQAFLNQKVGTGGSASATPGVCDSNGTRTSEFGGGTRAQYGAAHGNPAPFTCLKDYYEVPKTSPSPGIPANNYGGAPIPAGAKGAAQLIWDAAQQYNISPKVLLVNIQKESSGPLITDDWPFRSQYTYAMGAHCPDSGPNHSANCDSNYAGFSIQIAESAALFRYYLDNMGEPWWTYKKPGNNSILFNPNGACGSGNVFIESKATAALYTYTPYQPNGAALNNMYGTGDSCSAYGNRNFWRMYNDWFGKSVFMTSLLTYAPAIVSQTNGKINAFARGQDLRQWQTWFENGAWQTNWNYIDGPSPQSSAPSAVSWGPGHMDVFETRNGSLWHSWYAPDSIGWRGWSSLGKPQGVTLGNTPTVVAQAPGKINVFARGTDSRLWQTWYENGAWQTSWNYIDGPSSLSSAPTAVSWENGHMDVFDVRYGSLWHSWYSPDGGWRGWSPIGQP